jgi:hypothetical protein
LDTGREESVNFLIPIPEKPLQINPEQHGDSPVPQGVPPPEQGWHVYVGVKGIEEYQR